MTNSLAHRGPDDHSELVINNQFAQIGLGHRRLSIIDLSTNARQPMYDDTQRYCIAYNGEVYNYKEIRDELLNKGVVFNSDSDTEVILKAYIQWGIESLHKLIGMFAFVIFDNVKAELFFCRDRAGVKPFFYYWKDNLFLFGSELKIFHQHPYFNKSLDRASLALFLRYGYISAPNTIFKSTYKLRPGHYLKLNLQTRQYEERQYWNVNDFYRQEKIDISENDAIRHTEKLLTKAFHYRMVSDVPVGIFLSGGYDSTAVTSILQKDSTNKLKTFTIGFFDDRYNEAPYAKKIANYLGTEHTEKYCTEKEALDIVPRLPFIYDEPFGDSSAIPTYLLSQITTQSVKVALSADGGDEIFGGYNQYNVALKYNAWLKKVPWHLRNVFARAIHFLPLLKLLKFGDKSNKLRKLLLLIDSNDISQILRTLQTKFSATELQDLLLELPTIPTTPFDQKHNDNDNLDSMLSIHYQTFLVDDVLQKVDRATMSLSLEGREPLLDHNLIEFIARLPIQIKYKNYTNKKILKDIVHKHIPKELVDRPKKGFGVPLAKWIRTDLKPLVEHYLSNSAISKDGIFNPAEITKIKNFYLTHNVVGVQKIWYLLVFQMWQEKWL